MQVTQTNAEGLKREFKIVVPAGHIEDKVQTKLQDIGRTVRIPGFRPGKVPLPLLRKKYAASIMGEVLEAAVTEGASKAVADNGLRPAMQPKIEIVSFAEGTDLEFTIAMETLPEVETMDFSTVALERPKSEVPEDEVDKVVERLAEGKENSEPLPEGHAAEAGDLAIIDFVGKKDGEPFEGGKAEGYPLKIGSNTFIPGFEEQLIGAKAGDERTLKVTFPENYGKEELAGKEVEFDVKVNELRQPVKPEMDDAFAQGLGMDSMEAVRKAIREQIQGDYDRLSRMHVKRKLLDALAEGHRFEVPQGLVDIEFDAIWKQLQADKEAGRLDEDDKNKGDDELRQEYRVIAERRVRLGLLLSEVGRKNAISVTQDDMNRAVVAEAQRFPGQEHMVFQYYQQNKDAMDALRAPIYEDKVIDFILELAQVTDKAVSIEELRKDPEAAAPAAT